MKKIMRSIAVCMAMSMVVTGSMQTGVYAAGGKVTGVKVTNAKNKKIKLVEGKTFKLKVKVLTKGKVSKKVTYKSSNTKIVKVSKKGVVKAVKAGNAQIKVTSKANKKKKAVIKVSVSAKSQNSNNQQNQNTNNTSSSNTNNTSSSNTNQNNTSNNATNNNETQTNVSDENQQNSNETETSPGTNTEEGQLKPVVVERKEISLVYPEEEEDSYHAEETIHFNVKESGLYGAMIVSEDPVSGEITSFGEISEVDEIAPIGRVGDGFKLRKGRNYFIKVEYFFEKPENPEEQMLITRKDYVIKIVKMNTVNISFKFPNNYPDLHIGGIVFDMDGNVVNPDSVSKDDYYLNVYGYLQGFTGVSPTFDEESGKWQIAVPGGEYSLSTSLYAIKMSEEMNIISSDKYMIEADDILFKNANKDISVEIPIRISLFSDLISNAIEIGIGETTAEVSNFRKGVFVFTPSMSEGGKYHIYTKGTIDTVGKIYNNAIGDGFSYNDDNEKGINFDFEDIELIGGQTYYIVVEAYGDNIESTTLVIEKVN
jgi:hypothetical protein